MAAAAAAQRGTNEGRSMTPDFTPIASTLGGLILGGAAALLLAGNGRIAGITGILGGLVDGEEGRGWRIAFILGMLVGGLGLLLWLPQSLPGSAIDSPALVIAAGLLVGFGTRMANGCTSGHGVCGLGRFSIRSMVATATFMLTAIATVAIVRHGLGGLG
jgi:uncharacterized membrane protein YedE/YeeE